MAQTHPPGSSQAGWRGSRRQQEVARHRWQHDPVAASSGRPLTRGPWRKFRILAYFGLAGGLLALLVYYLLYSPARTPVLAVVATQYDWPLVPNAWAQEDWQGLADLDRQTLGLKDLTEAWRSPDRGLKELSAELAAFTHRRHTQPVILWLSMHGAVDGAGRPCLIPPGASPHDSQTWLPLADVLQQIKAAGLPAAKPKLLVLDANRQLVDWNTGRLANTFADALPKAVEAAAVPGLVVLNSTGPGEVAIAGSHLRGSVFGHFLRLGLAGAADGWAYDGNGNGRVTLHELTRYLQKQASGWTLHHRGTDQRPLLVPADARDFDVAFALRGSSWQSLVARACAARAGQSLDRLRNAELRSGKCTTGYGKGGSGGSIRWHGGASSTTCFGSSNWPKLARPTKPKPRRWPSNCRSRSRPHKRASSRPKAASRCPLPKGCSRRTVPSGR